uniref:Formin like 1 n=1 Tax=Oryzias sinensis TaxID=183150 RepID=A0A8C7ZZF5_9TELE
NSLGFENREDVFIFCLQNIPVQSMNKSSRFNAFNTMNLPPDKVEILVQYDNEKKWELICDQERFKVKNPPSAYLEKLKAHQFKRRVEESTPVLRELEISLRTNHIGWAKEFLNEENRGLDVLVNYLSFVNSSVKNDVNSSDRNTVCKDQHTYASVDNLNGSTPPKSSASRGSRVLTLRPMRNSRVSSQKDDVHLCIMCLRAIMNYQSGFSQVMQHPSCVNEITLSLNDRHPRTNALVLELLAAVCLVQGGHGIILSAFNNFKEVCGEKRRFEKLMEYFRSEESNLDFMVACMQFINIVVHSVEDLNFRVYLQHEFTQLQLDDYLEQLKSSESDRLLVQIQAYLDNLFDVGSLLEDAEAKNAMMEHVEQLQEKNLNTRLQESESEAKVKVSQLENKLIQTTKELELLKTKKPIQTKYRMPLLNWKPLQSYQVEGTIFSELDDTSVLKTLDMSTFEDQFKTKAQASTVDLGTLKTKASPRPSIKMSVVNLNRSKNLAITLRQEDKDASEICHAIQTYNLKALRLDFLELLEPFIPTKHEMKLIQDFEAEGRCLDELSEADRFMVHFSKIPRLPQHISTLTFMGNFPDSVQLIQPQLDAIIAASMSVKSSNKLKRILEIILAFGNYMNSGKQGPVYGFRLESLNLLFETKSTDRKQTLLHFIVNIIQEQYSDLQTFYTELHFLDKAVLVSLDQLLADVGALERGMELTKQELCEEGDNAVLKTFVDSNAQLLSSLVADGKTAQDAYESAVLYFVEDPKSTPPCAFFSHFNRFIKAYKVRKQFSYGDRRPKSTAQCLKTPCVKPHMDLMAELKKRQSTPLVREGKDGTIEDIISGTWAPRPPSQTSQTASRLQTTAFLLCTLVVLEETGV